MSGLEVRFLSPAFLFEPCLQGGVLLNKLFGLKPWFLSKQTQIVILCCIIGLFSIVVALYFCMDKINKVTYPEYKQLIAQGQLIEGTVINSEYQVMMIESNISGTQASPVFWVTMEYLDPETKEERTLLENWHPMWRNHLQKGDKVHLYYFPSNKRVKISSKNNYLFDREFDLSRK